MTKDKNSTNQKKKPALYKWREIINEDTPLNGVDAKNQKEAWVQIFFL